MHYDVLSIMRGFVLMKEVIKKSAPTIRTNEAFSIPFAQCIGA